MALKNMIKRLAGKKDEDTLSIPQIEKLPATREPFSVIPAEQINISKYKKIPLTELSLLGSAFSHIPQSARTITSTVTKNMNLPQKFYIGLNPKGISGTVTDYGQGISGNIMQVNSQGKHVIAGRMRFQEVNSLSMTETTSAVVPFDPMTMAIAAVLISINQKLDKLQEKAEEILQFLKLEKQSRLRGNLNMLTEIMAEYKSNPTDEKTCNLRVIAVQDIRREAQQDLHFYQEQITQSLQQQKLLHGSQQVQEMAGNVVSAFQEYQLASYLYGFSAFMELLLQKKFDDVHLNATQEKMAEYNQRYSVLYQESRAQIASYQRSSIETKLIGGIGNMVKNAGEKIAASSVLSKGQMDEALLHAGESISRFNRDTIEKRLEQFTPLEDCRLNTFSESIHSLDVLYNQKDAFLSDGENLYLINLE